MGALQAPAQTRTTRLRGFRARLTTITAISLFGLVVLWALAVALAVVGVLTKGSAFGPHGLGRHPEEIIFISAVAGGGLIVVLVTGLVPRSLGWRLSGEVGTVAALARDLAGETVPRQVEHVRRGGEATGASMPRFRTAETAILAVALAQLGRIALGGATREARLRAGVQQMLVSLGRRNQSLLHRQLRLIGSLEHKAADPAALADLFALEHLAARMRRLGESLVILSGGSAGRSGDRPVPLADVLRAAVAQVEDYTRVKLLTVADQALAGFAAPDVIHLLAELIDNATMFSPSTTSVDVRAEQAANGFVVEIVDRGLGLVPDKIAELNRALLTPPDFDAASADQLGLFVVATLAARHGIQVSLRPSPYGGTTAIVLLPRGLIDPQGADDAGEVGARAIMSAARQSGYPAAAERPALAAPSPVTTAARASESATQPSGQTAGLPRRVRKVHPSGERTPEQARDLVGAMQRGWMRARARDGEPAASADEGGESAASADEGGDGPSMHGETTGDQAAWPQGEEE